VSSAARAANRLLLEYQPDNLDYILNCGPANFTVNDETLILPNTAFCQLAQGFGGTDGRIIMAVVPPPTPRPSWEEAIREQYIDERQLLYGEDATTGSLYQEISSLHSEFPGIVACQNEPDLCLYYNESINEGIFTFTNEDELSRGGVLTGIWNWLRGLVGGSTIELQTRASSHIYINSDAQTNLTVEYAADSGCDSGQVILGQRAGEDIDPYCFTELAWRQEIQRR
jgi:hypothetical protein